MRLWVMKRLMLIGGLKKKNPIRLRNKLRRAYIGVSRSWHY